MKTLSQVWRVICFATQQQLLGNEPTACLANSTLKSCMGSQSFNNSLGAKWGSQYMIMVVECKCTAGGQPHMARQNMGSQNRLDQIMGCHTWPSPASWLSSPAWPSWPSRAWASWASWPSLPSWPSCSSQLWLAPWPWLGRRRWLARTVSQMATRTRFHILATAMPLAWWLGGLTALLLA